jgi:hypothetical protein
MQIRSVGINLGKTTFHLVALELPARFSFGSFLIFSRRSAGCTDFVSWVFLPHDPV